MGKELRNPAVKVKAHCLDRRHMPPARSRQDPAVTLSPLQQVVVRGETEEVRLFLTSSSTPEINAKDGIGRTALMLAVEVDSPDIIDLLLQHGAKPNEGNAFGTSALYMAVCACQHDCAKRLLLGGALVNVHSLRQRHAPLHAACADGDVQMVELLLAHGADPDVLDYRHRLPLHTAAEGGFADCLARLLQNGARVDVKDLCGLTPLGLTRDAVCRGALLEADAALSADDLRHLLRESPAVLQQLLDGGVQPGDGGVLQVSYKPLRDIGEAEHPFEGKFMTELHQSGRWELLGHPAVELLLQLTRQDSYFICHTAAKILWCLVFLVSLLSTMAVDLYRAGRDNRRLDTALKGFLVTLNCAQLVFLLVKLCVMGKRCFLLGRRWPVIVETVLIFVVVFLCDDSDKSVVYGFAVLMGFFELTMTMESISVWKITRAISSLLQVARSIAEYLFLYSPILIGFSISFFVIFGGGDIEGSNSFNSHNLVINMAAMVLGEVDVIEVEKHTPKSNFGYVMITIVFTMFVILVPIVMLNLLLALTISDTTKFLSKGGAEFLQNLANRAAWNQKAVFMIDRWVHKLKHLMPQSLFIIVAMYSLQIKWKSVLPRPAASVKATPRITVDPFPQCGKIARASVVGSSRNFRVGSELCQSLDRIVQTRRASEADKLLPLSLDAVGGDPVCGSGVVRAPSCETLGRSVPTNLPSTMRPCSGSVSAPAACHRHLRCCRSCADARSGTVLAEQLTAIQEKMDLQQTTQQRLVEQLDLQQTTQQRLVEQLDLQETTQQRLVEQLDLQQTTQQRMVEQLNLQQTTQQRLVEQVQTIENTLAKLNSC